MEQLSITGGSMKGAALERIKRETESLTLMDRLELIKVIVQHIRKKPVYEQNRLDWKELYGLGARIWSDDAQEFVNGMREERG